MICYHPLCRLIFANMGYTTKMKNVFIGYLSVGVINTLIHWCSFALFYNLIKTDQALSNLSAFCIAVTFSFFANTKYIFNTSASTIRYLLYIAIMGTLSVVVGASADKLMLQPIITLIVFSALSLICGFLYFKTLLFKQPTK